MEKKRKLSLPAWIFIGMVAGILAGLAFLKAPEFTTEWIKPIGTIYINLLKFLVVPVVVCSITAGVISLKDLKRVGSVGVKTFIYYMFTTALAVVIGLVIVNLFKGLFQPLSSAELGELTYEAAEAPSVMDVIVGIFPDNLFGPMVAADMLPVIVIAIFFGAGILAAGERGKKIGALVEDMNEVVMKIMMMIIKITPIGVFCLMTNVVAVNGPEIVGTLALVIGIAYLSYLIHVVVVYGLSVRFLSGMSPIKFAKGIYPAFICAFTTTSSNATLPLNIECCNNMGAEPEISSFVLPLGATINMDGTCIYLAVSSLFLANIYGVEIAGTTVVTLMLSILMLSIGAPGVTGSALICLSTLVAQLGIPVESVALFMGVDQILSMFRAAANSTGDAVVSVIVAKSEHLLDTKTFRE